MKHVKLYEQFLNNEAEAKLKYSKNWKQTNDTWYKNITNAQTQDMWANKGKTEKTITRQRDLAKYIDPDTTDWDKKSDAEVRKYLNDLKNKIKSETEKSKAYFSIEEKIEAMIKDGKVGINVQGDRVPDDLKSKFIMPCIMAALSPKDAWKFIHDTTSLDVNVTGRSVVNRFDVVYDGTIEDDKGKKIEFENINNGLAVVPG